jgi:ATP-dependent exoDNAse (exonuclease V) beta subunit
LFEQGDVVDTRASSEGDGPKEWLGTAGQPRVEAPRKPVILARIDPNSGRSLPLLHPSHLREYGRTIADHLAWNGRTETMERGTILHTCFAEVTWMEDSQWQDQLPQRLQKLFPGRANLNLLIDEFNRLLQTPSVTSLLHRTSYLSRVGPRILANQLIFEALTATAVNERPFAVRMDQAIVQGTIDRLVLIYEGDKLLAAEVIDYKTDDLPAADDAAIERRVDEYKPQIQAYRRAVAQFTNLPQEKVFARLLMLGIDREFEVR